MPNHRPRQIARVFVSATAALLLSSVSMLHAAEPAKAAAKPTFASLDQDANGQLTADEFLAAPGLPDPKIARRNFHVVDFNRDETLTEEEFRVLPGIVPVDDRGAVPDPVLEAAAAVLKTWREILSDADRNQDSELSATEWPAAVLKEKLPPFGDLPFESWDADANKAVDHSEAQRLIGLGYGTRTPDGTPARSGNGRVLYLSWIRTADRSGDHILSQSEFVASYWGTPADRAKLFGEIDQNGDRQLRPAEMLKAPSLNVDAVNLFLHLDKDLDGRLTADEIFGNPSTGATRRQAILSVEACDDDQDGKLSLREFHLAPAGLGYVVWRVLDRKDGDRDGFLSWKEFFPEPGPAMIGLASELFRRFDRDRDGRLGLDEFDFATDAENVPPEVAFRIKDANRDGRLTPEELYRPPEPAADDAPALERHRIRRERAMARFTRDDADQNGTLDAAEYAKGREAASRELGETPGEYSTRLFIADADGGNLRQLTDLPDFQKQGSPVWSADGRYIAFDGWKPQNGESFSAAQIVIVQADGQNPRVLGEGAMPSFSPRGHRLAYSSPRAGGVWVTSVDGPDQELVQIDERGWGTDWSPDGRLVFATSAGRGANLAVADIVEGRTEYLFEESRSPYQQISWNMVWSPDGKRIAFKGLTTEGKEELAIVDARGEQHGLIRRCEGPMLASFAWSPLENRVLFIKPDPATRRHQIFFVDPDTKDIPQLLPAQDDLRGYSDVAYSPDGKKIVFSCHKRVAVE